jgi:SAM-dependent methyltransferase
MPEGVVCALCGHDEPELVFIGRDRLHHVRSSEFRVVRCKRCSLTYLNPRPTWLELEEFYTQDYAPHVVAAASPLQRLIRSGGVRRKVRLVQRHRTEGALLDVGCGAGDFLNMLAQSRRWELYGIEPGDRAARHAAQVTGAEILNCRLEAADFAPHSLDVITLWHVMEHLGDPRGALTMLQRWLRPDGRLIMAVPILDSVDAKLFGPYWSGYDVPRHLYTYSKATLSEMLRSCGFSPVLFDRFIGGYDAFRISLSFWIDEQVQSSSLRSFLGAMMLSPILRVLMLPYFSAVNRSGRGSTLVVVAGAGVQA